MFKTLLIDINSGLYIKTITDIIVKYTVGLPTVRGCMEIFVADKTGRQLGYIISPALLSGKWGTFQLPVYHLIGLIISSIQP